MGGLFRNKEYDYEGKTGFFTECFKLYDVEKIRKGDFKMPEDKLLSGKKAADPAIPAGMEITNDDIPV